MAGTSAKVGIELPGGLEASSLDALSDIAGSVVGAAWERGCLSLGSGLPGGHDMGQVDSNVKRAGPGPAVRAGSEPVPLLR